MPLSDTEDDVDLQRYKNRIKRSCSTPIQVSYSKIPSLMQTETADTGLTLDYH